MKLIALAAIVLTSCSQPAFAQITVEDTERVMAVSEDACLVMARTPRDQYMSKALEMQKLYGMTDSEMSLMLRFCIMYVRGMEAGKAQRAW